MQYFSYPPGTKPHENDWAYLCQVVDWAPLGAKSTDKGKRKIQIIIKDKNKTEVLNEELQLESASIESKIKWENIETISLNLYEVGNQYAHDEYNKKLFKDGPRHLIALSYAWDGKKYIKRITEQTN